ncbi:MAG: ATP-binding cassette domain-containing protein [Pelagibacteraceae bacterium TMED246]|nr:MAG: ATP-binding cassette domain-containing protein [Pelagibacteraceae bacterium TMED246]|tara:strand:- start:29306 stop:30235 length:930 start_codon:yes stop_codon:yes gene_type:complete
MNKKKVLLIKNLNKIYKERKKNQIIALRDLNLEVNEGEIFGLLGPNGAGKSTFINILAGTVVKTSGTVIAWGFNLDINPRQVRASIGIVPQEINLDPFFSPRKLLELQAGLYGVKKKDRITDTILKLVSLNEHADTYSRSLSGGMKRRLLIAKSLVHQPPIVFLDEPTAGVDVRLRKNMWENVKILNSEGVTIILTTHYLEEAQNICDRIGILNKGKLVALDTTKNLLDRIKTKLITFKMNKNLTLSDEIYPGVKLVSSHDKSVTFSYDKNKIKLENLINLIKSKNIEIIDILTDDGDLEDIFIELTNN